MVSILNITYYASAKQKGIAKTFSKHMTYLLEVNERHNSQYTETPSSLEKRNSYIFIEYQCLQSIIE